MTASGVVNSPAGAAAGDAARPLVVGVGGFLGAGKTTSIVRATRRLVAQGTRVAIVTNDQASDLVDTALARTATEAVSEIPGGCFCCRYDVLERTLADLIAQVQPDVVFAEAVGSCTDLAATVYQPLRQRGVVPVRLGPLSVVIDARRLLDTQLCLGGKIGADEAGEPSTEDDVTYLYRKQFAEADVLLLNKVDLLSASEQKRAEALLAELHPGVPVVAMSAAGDVSAAGCAGMDGWITRLVETPGAGGRALDLDYDRYAAAEASLGWLNLEGTLALGAGGSVAEWVRAVLEGVRREAVASQSEIAHVKVCVVPGTGTGAPSYSASSGGSIVGNDRDPVVWAHGMPESEARVLVNARVATWPDVLRAWIEGVVRDANQANGAVFTLTHLSAFSPARPVPVHRMAPA
jgi:Ni2+-binding GTPase involved in maturation of urease and hydrogenase